MTDKTTVLQAMREIDVFEFLAESMRCQAEWPGRFRPAPSVFVGDDGEPDAKLIKNLFSSYSRKVAESLAGSGKTDDDVRKAVGDKLYSAFQFIVSKIPLKLTHATLKHEGTVIDMYRVQHSDSVESAFQKVGRVPTYLYHGSPMTNWYSIMFNGIKVMSGTAEMTSGAVHGAGVYLSSMLSRSHSFCGAHKGAFVVGVYEVYDSAKYATKSVPDIHVIPTTDLLLLRYMLWIKGGSKVIGDMGEALNALLLKNAERKASASSSAARKRNGRIDKELALLTEAKYELKAISDTVYSVRDPSADGKLYTVDMGGKFPIDPPSITLEDGKPLDGGWRESWSIKSTVKGALFASRTITPF